MKMSRLDFSQVSIVQIDVYGWQWDWVFGNTGGILEPLRDEVHQAQFVLLRAGQMSTTESIGHGHRHQTNLIYGDTLEYHDLVPASSTSYYCPHTLPIV